MTLKVAIVGALGRMGKALCTLANEDPSWQLVAAITAPEDPAVGSKLTECIPGVSAKDIIVSCNMGTIATTKPHVIIDFSSPDSTTKCVAVAVSARIPLVIGSTGLNRDQEAIVEEATKSIPLIHAMNYSLGVNILIALSEQATTALGPEFDIEIVEAHHNKKVDAPSGTALALADGILEKRKGTRDDLVDGRSGRPGPRTQKEIGMHAVRMGGVVGDHHVLFGNQFERIELTHRAMDRNLFAAGALKAAKYIATSGGTPRRVTMKQVLFGEK